MTTAIRSIGTLFQVETTPGGGTYVTIAELTAINPALSSDELDVTNHDSASRYREFIQGLKSGEFSIEGNYLPGNSTHDTTTNTGLLSNFDAGTVKNWKIIFPDSGSTTWTFAGIVREHSVSGPVDDKLSFTATVRVTAAMTLS
jgi:predicted secreted protein